jgi:hypothetical protein
MSEQKNLSIYIRTNRRMFLVLETIFCNEERRCGNGNGNFGICGCLRHLAFFFFLWYVENKINKN